LWIHPVVPPPLLWGLWPVFKMRVLITGVNGYVAWHLLQTLPAGVELWGTLRPGRKNQYRFPVISLDLQKEVAPALRDVDVDAVIHTAAISSLAQCEQEPQKAMRINGEATAELADWCAEKKAHLVYLSTDIVFDGEHAPYAPDDSPAPINVYGKSKYAGELAVREGAVVRLALLLGRSPHKKNFVDWFLERAENNLDIPLFYDEVRTPVPTMAAARKIWEITLARKKGRFHLAGKNRYNRLELGQALCAEYGLRDVRLKPVSLKKAAIPRPRDVRLKIL